jgi:6-pyruvoyltetrahydropterin/6-carboxytetrahydropterin synthase
MDRDPLMRVTQCFTFEAAHRLPNVPDTHRCKRMHGHGYRVELTFEGAIDLESGFVVDFLDIEAVFASILDQLDHRTLNEVAGLENPTAENIAIWVFDRVRPLIPSLCGVRLYETAMCWAEYGSGSSQGRG